MHFLESHLERMNSTMNPKFLDEYYNEPKVPLIPRQLWHLQFSARYLAIKWPNGQ